LKIAIIGDTHGSTGNLHLIADTFKDVDFFAHTGDNWVDGRYLESVTEKPVLTVKGNCDFGEMSTELVFQVQQRRIYLTHGHMLGVKSGLFRLGARARELAADFCLYGHTHMPLLEYREGITFLNPGSLTFPRSQERYAGILLEEKQGVFTCQFMETE